MRTWVRQDPVSDGWLVMTSSNQVIAECPVQEDAELIRDALKAYRPKKGKK